MSSLTLRHLIFGDKSIFRRLNEPSVHSDHHCHQARRNLEADSKTRRNPGTLPNTENNFRFLVKKIRCYNSFKNQNPIRSVTGNGCCFSPIHSSARPSPASFSAAKASLGSHPSSSLSVSQCFSSNGPTTVVTAAIGVRRGVK